MTAYYYSNKGEGMNAVKFPDMLSLNKTSIIRDKDATMQNLRLLLLSFKNSMFGDPNFGSNLRRLLFENNNVILQSLVIDDIYSLINTYMPQIRVLRKNITVTSDGNTVKVNIIAQNMLDYGFDEYSINLLNVEEM